MLIFGKITVKIKTATFFKVHVNVPYTLRKKLHRFIIAITVSKLYLPVLT